MSLAKLSPTVEPTAEEQAQASVLKTLLATAPHFFGGFIRLFTGVSDPRQPELITYPLAAVLFAGLLMFVCRLGARRQIGLMFRDNAPSASKFEVLFQVAGCPHGDTLDATFSRLQPAELQAVVTGLTATLIRHKVFYPDRLLGHYYCVAIDGTGVLVFAERHCAQCLTRTRDGVTIYYHPVLEAKLVTATGCVFSLMTEFIENPGEHPTQQDCELKAFYRLADRLKQRFPRLPLCLLLDGLFAGGPTFTRCEQYDWKYLITLQDGDLPSVHQDFEALTRLAPENRIHFTPNSYPPVAQDFRWMNDLPYVDTEPRVHSLSVIDCLETASLNGQPHTTRFRWVSNFNVTAQKVIPSPIKEVGSAGRSRTKASMFKKTGATRWNTPTLKTPPPPKSFTSSCRSPICSVS